MNNDKAKQQLHIYNNQCMKQASVAQSDARPTGDREVAGLIPAKPWNILSWRLTMKYILWLFYPFCWFKKGTCQFLAK